MWLVGLSVLFLTLGLSIVLLNRGQYEPPAQSRFWDMVSQATSYQGMMAPMASFSVTSAVFVATLSRSGRTDQLEHMMALFLIGFMAFVGSGVGFATTRSAVTPADATPEFRQVVRLQFTWAYSLFFIGISLTWLGLRPLALVIGLTDLADLLSWCLLVALFGAAANQGFWQHYVAGTTMLCSIATPTVALVGAALYHTLVLPFFPALVPPNHVLDLVRVVFVLGAAAFVADLTVLRLHGLQRADVFLARAIPRFAPPVFACTSAAVFLLWFALVSHPAHVGRPLP